MNKENKELWNQIKDSPILTLIGTILGMAMVIWLIINGDL